jgi:osmotically-inducible protein OsmY
MREFLDQGRIEFRPATRRDDEADDARIRADILARLAGAPWLDARAVAVRVTGGVVRLEGRVPDRRMARAIKEVAAGCGGVRGVAEHLRVAHPPDTPL